MQRQGRTRDVVASRVGLRSGRTLERADLVVTVADALRADGKEAEATALLNILNHQSIHPAFLVARAPNPAQVLAKLATGAATTVPQARCLLIADAIRLAPEPLPTGPFRVIVADPPWPVAARADDLSHCAQLPYPTMTLDAIRALPVGGLAATDAVLWLWAVNAQLPAALSVLEAWGFQYRTVLTWVKDRMGTGYWLRGMSEPCLFATRGKPVVTLTNETTVLYGRVREHSRKPQEFFALVEALCPGAKVELFARQSRPGWQAWGAEKGRFDDDPA